MLQALQSDLEVSVAYTSYMNLDSHTRMNLTFMLQKGHREFEQKRTVHEQKLKGEREQFEVSVWFLT